MKVGIAFFVFISFPFFVNGDSLSVNRIIKAKDVIEKGDIAILEDTLPGSIDPSTNIIGMEARVTLYPGRPIMQNQIQLAAAVERNQIVVLKYIHGGLLITASARALSRGSVGAKIRVMNLASRNIVMGEVTSAGVVAISDSRAM